MPLTPALSPVTEERVLVSRLTFDVSRTWVFERADRLDRDRHDVTRLEIRRRVEAYAHPRAGAGGDEIARLERHHARYRLDQGRHVEDQLAHVGVLAHFAIHSGDEMQLAQVFHLVGGDDARSHRA